MKKIPPRSAPPFRGVDLLDMTYGIAEHYQATEIVCCRCRRRFVADERRIECAGCSLISLRDHAGSSTFDIEFLTDDLYVTIPRKGRRSECYQFFANCWWELDPQFNRSEQVSDRHLIARLQRLSGSAPVKQRERVTAKPYVEYMMLGSGRVLERRTAIKPVCDCLSEEMHDIYPDAGGLCPLHGIVCDTCGLSH